LVLPWVSAFSFGPIVVNYLLAGADIYYRF
jgi:hypothetical protein